MMCATLTAAMTLGELLGPAAGPHAAIEISDLVMDSRDVRPGAAFVAVPGETRHGLDFAAAAHAQGAAVILYEPSPAHAAVPEPAVAVPGLRRGLGDLARRFFGPVTRAEDLVGVTGTNGKTTVAYLVAQAFGRLGRPCGYIGTLGFGVPPALSRHSLTTPDCLTLHREIATLGTAAVALEVSSHALAQDRIAGLTIRTAAFTNLSRDHLDAHGTLERYGDVKARLFERPGVEAAVLNLEDAFAANLRGRIGATVAVLGVGLHAEDADITGTLLASDLGGIELDIGGRHGRARLASRLVGDFNAENLLVALGVLVAAGRALPEACAALADCAAPAGRMERFGGGPAAPVVIVDYAHTPAALERVLAVIEPLTPGELTCVFGCGGGRDAGKRPLMGSAAAARADRIVLTDDNPRNEPSAAIIADIRRGIPAGASVSIEPDREAAILGAIRNARPGDVVLVAGKGHETTQDSGERIRELDDRRIVAAALVESTAGESS